MLKLHISFFKSDTFRFVGFTRRKGEDEDY